MNRNNEHSEINMTLERLRRLENRIEALESAIMKHRDRFLEEDLKARGLQ